MRETTHGDGRRPGEPSPVSADLFSSTLNFICPSENSVCEDQASLRMGMKADRIFSRSETGRSLNSDFSSNENGSCSFPPLAALQ